MKQIIDINEKLSIFLRKWLPFKTTLPQIRHIARFMEGSLALDGKKTLTKIVKINMDSTHPSSLADFFTCSKWKDKIFRANLFTKNIKWVTENCKKGSKTDKCHPIVISIDDSDASKPQNSRHFEPVDWFCDEKGYKHAVVFVSVHITCGKRGVPVDFEIYLKRKTIRKLNRKIKDKKDKIKFLSKMLIAMELLKKVKPYIPDDYPVYVTFDSWYASKKLINFCLAQGWHVICRLKSNRSFNGKKLSQMSRKLKEKSFRRISLKSADRSTTYWVSHQKGKIKGIPGEVSAIISRRSLRDRRSNAFFLCTDTRLSAKEAMMLYGKRWDIEVDYLYMKDRLGLEDFRVRSLEAIRRYFLLVFFILTYLRWRQVTEGWASIAGVICIHRKEQYEQALTAFGNMVLKTGSLQETLCKFL